MKSRKEEIIEACINLICEKGLETSSMQKIANEVGITKSTLYFHFDSKESLYQEVYFHCHRLDAIACNEGLDAIANPIEKLCKRMENIINYAIAHPKESQVEVIFSVSPLYRKESELVKYDFLQDIIKIMEPGIKENVIRDTHVWLLAEWYYGVTAAMYKKFIKEPELWEDEEVRNSCFEMLRNTFSKE